MSSKALEFLVGFSLPKHAEFGIENYAGDEVVSEFITAIKSACKIEFEVFVSWQSLPDVMVLRKDGRNVIVRSERLDTMLIEQIQLLRDLQNEPSQERAIDRSMASIYRWQAEYFVGHRKPVHALLALKKRHEEHVLHSSIIPFRDDCLDSVDEVLRAAVQCFCLAHEIGHIVWPANEAISLNAPIEGVSPMRHLERDFREQDFSGGLGARTAGEAATGINAKRLMSEINADFFAIEVVVQFIHNKFDISMSDAFYAVSVALRAQYFMDSLKTFTLSIAQYNGSQERDQNPIWVDSVLNAQTSIRARCSLRHAGIFWAHYENAGVELTSQVINRYVPLVDSLVLPDWERSILLQHCTTVCGFQISDVMMRVNPKEMRDIFEEYCESVQNNGDMKLDLFYLLIAYGCPGGVDFETYLRSMVV